MTNMQVTTGGLPTGIWDMFWEELEEYDAEVGSCWGFSYVEIPAYAKQGTAYVIYAIVTSDVTGEIYYVAVRWNIIPQ